MKIENIHYKEVYKRCVKFASALSKLVLKKGILSHF